MYVDFVISCNLIENSQILTGGKLNPREGKKQKSIPRPPVCVFILDNCYLCLLLFSLHIIGDKHKTEKLVQNAWTFVNDR